MDDERDAERLLRAAEPAPSSDFVRTLEARLHDTGRRPAWLGRSVPVLAGGALAAMIATVGLGISLAGVGPFSSDAGNRVEADDRCPTVKVTRIERVPTVVTNADGRITVERRAQRVTRHVKRCD